MDSREREAHTRVRNHSSKLADDLDRIECRRAGTEPTDDTKIRYEIQLKIRALAQGGKSKLGIMNRLNVQYRDIQYKSYRQYFERWVDNELRKRVQTKPEQDWER